jgi:CelD/BcsL family acetyltransferase involved in cellulose biosynthesis
LGSLEAIAATIGGFAMTAQTIVRANGCTSVPALRVAFLRAKDLTDADRAAWQRLADSVAEPNVFYEPSFSLAALRQLEPRKHIHLAFVWDDVENPVGTVLVAVIPVELERRLPLPFSVAGSWHHPFAVLASPLIAAGREFAVFAAFFDQLAALRRGPRFLLWCAQSEDGAIARALALFAATTGRPASLLSEHSRAQLVCRGSQSFRSQLSTTRKRQIRRQRRRLEEAGTVDVSTVSCGPELAAGIEDFLTLEASGWKGRTGTAARSRPSTEAFLRDAVGGLAGLGKVRIDRLSLDGKPIAAAIVLSSGGIGSLWKIAYSEAHARFAPGIQLLYALSNSLSDDPAFRSVDSCTAPGHALIESLWPDRIRISHRIVAVRAGEGTLALWMSVTFERAHAGIREQAKRIYGLLRRSRTAK